MMSRRRSITCSLLAACLLSGSHCWAQSGFAGSFSAGELRLELREHGPGIEGTLSIRADACPLRGSVRDHTLHAEFEFGGSSYPLQAIVDADGSLVLTSGGQVHRLSRIAATGRNDVHANNPLADPALLAPAPSAPPASSAPADFSAAELSKSVALASGCALRCPDEWSVTRLGPVTTLVPPARNGGLVPSAMYGVHLVPLPMEGLRDHEQIMVLVNQLLTGLLGDVRMIGEIEPLGAGVLEGVRAYFSGESLGEVPMDFSVCARPTTSGLLVIVGMGELDAMRADARVVRDIARSFRIQQEP